MDDQDHDADQEQDPGDLRRHRRYAEEAQGAGDEPHDQKHKCIVEHRTVLLEALATKLVCVLRYKRHYYMAAGIHAQAAAAEFLDHANEEQGHADVIAERIVQLGGAPDMNPDGLLSRSHSEYAEGEDLVDMIREDLVAERGAVDSYREMIEYLGDDDPTTRRRLEEILHRSICPCDLLSNFAARVRRYECH